MMRQEVDEMNHGAGLLACQIGKKTTEPVRESFGAKPFADAPAETVRQRNNQTVTFMPGRDRCRRIRFRETKHRLAAEYCHCTEGVGILFTAMIPAPACRSRKTPAPRSPINPFTPTAETLGAG